MPQENQPLYRLAEKIEKGVDAVVGRIRSAPRAGLIVPYIGFGNEQELRLRGRVVRSANPYQATEKDSRWRNLRSSLSRFFSREIPHIEVRASVDGDIHRAVTNDEGYFELRCPPAVQGPATAFWHEITLTLPALESQAVQGAWWCRHRPHSSA